MPSWQDPPRNLPPLETTVQVWAVRLDDSTAIAGGQDLLSDDERDRAARFRFERHRRRYLAAHVALHEILGRYIAISPARLNFELGANGKPRLLPAIACGLEFNLSHSNEVALVAVSQRRELGVDVEHVRQTFEFQEVAERFFTAKEVAALRGLPQALQRQGFFKCWTSKEAFLKAKGTGLSGALDEVEISLTSDRGVQIAAAVPGWWLCELPAIAEYQAALVGAEIPVPIHCYRWLVN